MGAKHSFVLCVMLMREMLASVESLTVMNHFINVFYDSFHLARNTLVFQRVIWEEPKHVKNIHFVIFRTGACRLTCNNSVKILSSPLHMIRGQSPFESWISLFSFDFGINLRYKLIEPHSFKSSSVNKLFHSLRFKSDNLWSLILMVRIMVVLFRDMEHVFVDMELIIVLFFPS